MKNRTRALAVAGSATALLATLVAAAPGPAASPAPRLAAVHGAASVLYAYSPDDDIRFTVDADAAPFSRPLNAPGGEKGLPTDARGKVTVYHYSPGHNVTGTSEAEVDCLVTGGRTATITAVVTKSTVGETGRRIGISVQDGEHGEPDRLGFSWGIANADVKPDGSAVEATVGTCMAPAPFTTVIKGGFKVAPAPLPPLPH
ncbi:hypothetical protein ACFXDJ_08070 [Streptomyces sp. NPDC059443]|uniref:hypothetical protein n=1 Tax=unclassified Streptomyces TaxID=2593676 RepID=UPI00369A4C33